MHRRHALHVAPTRDIAGQSGPQTRGHRAEGARGFHAVGRCLRKRDARAGLDLESRGRGRRRRRRDQDLHAQRHGHVPGPGRPRHGGGASGDVSPGSAGGSARRRPRDGAGPHAGSDGGRPRRSARLRGLTTRGGRGLRGEDAARPVSANRSPRARRARGHGRGTRRRHGSPCGGATSVRGDVPALPRVHRGRFP